MAENNDHHGHNEHGHDHGAAAGHDHGHGHGHGEPHEPMYYVRIWGILLVLLVISIAGPVLEIPVVTLITAFGVAAVKAFIVMKYFMHLDVEKPYVIYLLTTSVVFMVVMFGGVSVDVMEHEGSNWENVAAKSWVDEQMALGEAGAEHHGGGEHGADAAHGDAGHGADAGHAPAGDGHDKKEAHGKGH